MAPFNHLPMGKARRLLSTSGNYDTSESSLISPAHITGSKLDKLKKIWQRRPKLITPGGGRSAITTASMPSYASPRSLTAKASCKKYSRRTTIGTGMIGFPRDFVHSQHVGIHDVKEVAYHPRHSIGALQMHDSNLTSSLYRLTDSEAESQSEEEKTPVAVVRRQSQHERCSLGSSHLPARQVQSVPPPPRLNKVKRKSVPVHVFQDLPEATAQPFRSDDPTESTQNRFRFSQLAIEETVQELMNYNRPQSFVDEKASPLRMIGGEYISQTVRAR